MDTGYGQLPLQILLFDTGMKKEAQRLGVPRQSLIKIWIAEKLQGV
jgi:hypothetical protein